MNHIENPGSRQQNSRVGFTVSVPLTAHQALKFAFGAYIRFGGDYKTVTASWQYSWIHEPR